jgi:hypothetical protein
MPESPKKCCELAMDDVKDSIERTLNPLIPEWNREAAHMDWAIAKAHLRYCQAEDKK